MSVIGSGQSENGTEFSIAGILMGWLLDDIVLTARDMNQVPQEMEQHRVSFLDAMD